MTLAVTVIKVIRCWVVEVYCQLNQPQPENARIEIDVGLRIAGDSRHVMNTRNPVLHSSSFCAIIRVATSRNISVVGDV
jgi:hypothetical protein